MTTLIYNYFTRPALGLLGGEVQAPFAALLPSSVRSTAPQSVRAALARWTAVATAEVAMSADVEHGRAQSAPTFAQRLVVASVRHGGRHAGNLPAPGPSSLHCVMSRGKKTTKADQRHRRDKRERLVADRIGDLSCGFAAADVFAGMCGLAQEEAGYNVDMVVAAEALWRRATSDNHALTLALVELRAELARHHEVMRAFEKRFDALMGNGAHDHIKPEPEDIQRIRAAMLGPEQLRPQLLPAAS